MKKLLKVALVAGCMIFLGNFAKAQTKIGYLNTQDLITAMPELKTVNTQMDAFKKTFIDQLTGLSNEFTAKSQDYQAKKATMTDAVRTVKESELTDLQKRYNDFQTSANQQVEAKGNELMKPILDKAHAAIDAVAKEKGYSYVFDTSSTALLVSPPADDLLASVKLRLGLK